jgi:hypothetical protein
MKTSLLSLSFIFMFFGCSAANDTTKVSCQQTIWSQVDFLKEIEKCNKWLSGVEVLSAEQYVHLVYLYNTIIVDLERSKANREFINAFTPDIRRTIAVKLGFDISVRCSYSKQYDLYFGCNNNGTSVYTITE